MHTQVLHLTRLRRPSFSASNSNNSKLPLMANNVLYDMDSSTSPSSSDSDCPDEHGQYKSEGSLSDRDENVPHHDDVSTRETQMPFLAKANISISRSTHGHLQQRPVTPLKENSMNQIVEPTMLLGPRQLVTAVEESKKNRRRTQSRSKDPTPQKRWV